MKPFAFTAIELTKSAVALSAVNVDSSAPVFEIFHTVASVKSARTGTFGSTTTLSGLTGADVGTAFGSTTRALALDPAIQILPAVSAAIAVAILEAPCVSARRHFSAPSAPIARTLESFNKTMSGPATSIFVSGVIGVARFIATIAFTLIGLGAAEAICEEKISGRVKSATAKRFTIVCLRKFLRAITRCFHSFCNNVSKI